MLQDALVIQTGCSEFDAELAALGQGALSPPPGREAHVAKWKRYNVARTAARNAARGYALPPRATKEEAIAKGIGLMKFEGRLLGETLVVLARAKEGRVQDEDFFSFLQQQPRVQQASLPPGRLRGTVAAALTQLGEEQRRHSD